MELMAAAAALFPPSSSCAAVVISSAKMGASLFEMLIILGESAKDRLAPPVCLLMTSAPSGPLLLAVGYDVRTLCSTSSALPRGGSHVSGPVVFFARLSGRAAPALGDKLHSRCHNYARLLCLVSKTVFECLQEGRLPSRRLVRSLASDIFVPVAVIPFRTRYRSESA